MVDPQIKSQWKQQAYYAAPSGRAFVGGEITVGTPVLITDIKVERDVRRVGGDGVQIATTHVVLSEEVIGIGSLFWINGTDETNVAEALTVRWHQPFEDEYGNIDHYEMGLGGEA